MTERARHLKAAFATAQTRTKLVTPELLFIASTYPDAVPLDSGSEADNERIWDAIEAEFKFLRFVSVTGLAPSVEDHDRWADLLAWMSAELATWSANRDPGLRKLRALLLLTSSLDWDGAFWPELPVEISANKSLLDAIDGYIRTLTIKISPVTGHTPIANSESIEKFNQADVAGDWVAISEVLPRMERGFVDPVLKQAARYLGYFDFDRLISATNQVRQTLVAAGIAEALGAEEALRLAIGSASLHQKFASTYLAIHHRNLPLEPAAQHSLTSLLIQVSADLSVWRDWMKVFNTYPVRFPALQIPLGAALACVSLPAISSYVESLSLHTTPHTERDLVAVCLRTFRTIANIQTRQALWSAAQKRWAEWDFDRCAEHPYLFEASWAALDYAVVGYFIECLISADLNPLIEEILARVNVVDRDWHPSLTHCISARNRLLSRLQPLAHAQHVIKTGDEWLAIDKHYRVSAASGAPYYALKYSVH